MCGRDHGRARVAMTKDGNNGGGIGLLGVIGVVLIILKLCGVIHVSWWWATAPLWGPWALVATLVLTGVILKVITELAR